jgi:hypothetical protein
MIRSVILDARQRQALLDRYRKDEDPEVRFRAVLDYRVVDRCPVAFGDLDRVKPSSWMTAHPPPPNSST